MKARVKCPICRRTVSQHCLLYTHRCGKQALDERPKMARVEEKYPEPKAPEPAQPQPPTPEPEEPEPVLPEPEPKRVRRPRVYEEYEEIPEPPPLIRQPVRAEPQYTYEQVLRMRQLEQARQRAHAQIAPIRNHFRR